MPVKAALYRFGGDYITLVFNLVGYGEKNEKK
jgi:hypothetical protein